MEKRDNFEFNSKIRFNHFLNAFMTQHNGILPAHAINVLVFEHHKKVIDICIVGYDH